MSEKQKNKDKDSAPVYKSRYGDALKNNLAKVMAKKNFSYDADKDKLFSQYKNSYEKSGRTAMRDTMGNAASLTGGYGNSYAVTAGQQAYNSYMSKLSDKIPELEQRAYERYKDDEESAYKRLNTLIGLEKSDYGRYRDSVDDYNTNRNFEYNKSKDALAQRNLQAQFERDNYENDRDYNRRVYENDRDYAQKVYDNDRNYQIKLNSSLKDAVEKPAVRNFLRVTLMILSASTGIKSIRMKSISRHFISFTVIRRASLTGWSRWRYPVTQRVQRILNCCMIYIRRSGRQRLRKWVCPMTNL